MTTRNNCYTCFKMTGNFEPNVISSILGLHPEKQWSIGDKRKDGTECNFSLWEIGRCETYDVYVENQMASTIQPLLKKVNELKKIKKEYDVSFTLEVVPSIYVGDLNPCLAPSAQIIKFCYETDTAMDIDLFVFDSNDI